MSEIALDTIKAIKERLSEVIADLDRMEDALHNAPPGAIEELVLPKEALEELPWKPYRSGSGAWIFSDIEDSAAKRLREAPKDCIVIEDAEAGVKAAKQAGMFCVGYRNPNSGRQDLSKADIVVDDFSKLDIQQLLQPTPVRGSQ